MDVIGGNRLADYHGFIPGAMVIEYGDHTKTKREVVSVGGLRKDDHIQLDDKKTHGRLPVIIITLALKPLLWTYKDMKNE